VTGQLLPALMAILLGILAGVLLFVPFVAIQYRRQGRLTVTQTVVWAGFLVYGLALWTYTLLPLPVPEEIRCAPKQLRPLQFIDDVLGYPIGSIGEILRNPAIMQVALNVLLFFPLGFFLRFTLRRGVVATTAIGFVISLLIETTQLTGVWGIYPCAYRIFDVDDLLANTAGALLGGLCSLALRPWLARRDATVLPGKPTPITVWRRLLGMLCDAMVVWLTSALAGVISNAWQLYVLAIPAARLNQSVTSAVTVAVPLVLTAALTLATGRSAGDLAVLICWQSRIRPRLLARLLRYLCGVGGWQLLVAFASPLDWVFAAAGIVALLATTDRGGLPGIVARMRPVDSRAPSHDPL